MLILKIKDFFTPIKKKTDILYRILQDKTQMSDIKYLFVCGNGGNTQPDDAYKLINLIQRKYDIKTFNYGYWTSGCMVFNSLKIINGECEIGVEFR